MRITAACAGGMLSQRSRCKRQLPITLPCGSLLMSCDVAAEESYTVMKRGSCEIAWGVARQHVDLLVGREQLLLRSLIQLHGLELIGRLTTLHGQCTVLYFQPFGKC